MSNYTQYPKLYGVQAIEAAEVVRQAVADHGCAGKPGPVHMSAYLVKGVFYNGGCRSGSMWYNPFTKTLVGRAHCSCEESCY